MVPAAPASPGAGAPLPVALRIAYDGGRFDAYARDPRLRTVEGTLVDALRHEGLVGGSFRTGSRTDAGVSALENVVRCDLARPHLRGLVPALQGRLPDGLWATGAAAVAPGWNPRYGGAVRRYAYHAVDDGEDVGRMRAAAAAFVGTHDLRAFARLEPKRNPRRDVLLCSVARADGPGLHLIHVESPGFLWNQVRRMASAILAVGRGAAEPEDVAASLRTGRPHRAFRLAPAEGLVLERVRYDPEPAWEPRAGAPEAARLVREVQGAEARRVLVRHVRGLGRRRGARAG